MGDVFQPIATEQPLSKQMEAVDSTSSEELSHTLMELSEPKPFPFLKLPRELREMIYDYSVDDEPTTIYSWYSNSAMLPLLSMLGNEYTVRRPDKLLTKPNKIQDCWDWSDWSQLHSTMLPLVCVQIYDETIGRLVDSSIIFSSSGLCCSFMEEHHLAVNVKNFCLSIRQGQDNGLDEAVQQIVQNFPNITTLYIFLHNDNSRYLPYNSLCHPYVRPVYGFLRLKNLKHVVFQRGKLDRYTDKWTQQDIWFNKALGKRLNGFCEGCSTKDIRFGKDLKFYVRPKTTTDIFTINHGLGTVNCKTPNCPYKKGYNDW